MKASDKQQDITEELNDIREFLLSLFEGKNREQVKGAIEFAENLLEGEKRLNGDPWISHPLMVALKTAQIGLGPNSVSAALLHDVIEDNPDDDTLSEKIDQQFGEDVLKLVISLTKINSNVVEKSSTSELLAARLYLLSTISDLRVIMIKLADKLHNLMTIEGLSASRQESYMEEIERIYLPIAEYLGLGALHREISDLLFKKKHPEEYSLIATSIRQQTAEETLVKSTLVDELSAICQMESLSADITGRVKGIRSIHGKMRRYEKDGMKSSLEYIKDIIAFRILCDSKDDCYLTYSLLQQFYEIDFPTDDHIANPKPNGYRAIHVILRHPEFGTFEVQIKTHEMHEYNEYGPASHIAYKVAGRSEIKPTEEFNWAKNLSFSNIYYNTQNDGPIRTKLFDDTIFVLTPKHDFIKLPKGATPIDMAYEIHTEIGNQCIGAIVNNRPVTIDTELKTGDIVEIQTNPKKKHASESWLEFVITEQAIDMIRKSVRRRIHNI